MAWSTRKHVPTNVRNACLARDGNQCTATMRTTGPRCPETTNLEAAHWEQYDPTIETTVEMVRTLCSWHHQTLETKWQAAKGRANGRKYPYRRPERHPGLQ